MAEAKRKQVEQAKAKFVERCRVLSSFFDNQNSLFTKIIDSIREMVGFKDESSRKNLVETYLSHK